MAKRKDADIVDAARFVAIEKANEWIGLPFDVRGSLLSLVQLPKTMRKDVRKEGFFSWAIGCLILLLLMWIFAPLRQALIQLQLGLAVFFISIWLFFLPFILIAAGIYFLEPLWLLIKRPTASRAKTVSRAGIRIALLASTYLIDMYWGEAIRAFISDPKAYSIF